MTAEAQNTGPMVLVYIGDDDPTRGDSHGFKGIGRKLAEKLQGEFHYLEDKDLDRLYPELKSNPEKELARYFEDHKKPDIILSTRFPNFKKSLGRHPVQHYKSYNEYLSADHLNERELVSHHLTPELLASEGKKFREAYPDISRPLIALMTVYIPACDAFIEKLVSKCAAYPKATIFLCASRRTSEDHYKEIISALRNHVRAQDLQHRVMITGYNFQAHEKEAGHYNPYIGLLNEADHVIVCGSSQSIVSEVVATEKPAILYDTGYSYDGLIKKGLAFEFNKCAARTLFDKIKIEPVNLTDQLAEKLAEKFRNRAQKKSLWEKLKPSVWMKKICRFGTQARG